MHGTVQKLTIRFALEAGLRLDLACSSRTIGRSAHERCCNGKGEDVTADGTDQSDHGDADEVLLYKTSQDATLNLHVFRPPARLRDDRRPCIVFFFGGGWIGGDPGQFFPHCRYFASRGMVAMSAEYRVESRHGTTPYASVADGKSAVRWIRGRAQELGVDPNRLAAGGGSAGGQVAAAAALSSAFDDPSDDLTVICRPDALVLFNPCLDAGPSAYAHEQVKERWREFSPIENVKTGAPPTIVFLGSEDKIVPVATAREFKRRMEQVGSRCDLHIYEGQAHGFFNYLEGRNRCYDETVIAADRFLASLSYIEGEPTMKYPSGDPPAE